MQCYNIFSVALCVELTEFVNNIFKMPIFKPPFHFFEIFKANIVKHLERVMTIYFFPDVLILRGKNPENIMHEIFACRQIAI